MLETGTIHQRSALVYKILLTALAVGAAAPAFAESELDEVLRRPPAATYRTTNSPASLEYCFGLALANFGVPFVLHGDKETLMGSERVNLFLFTVQIRPDGEASQVIVRSKDRHAFKLIRGLIEACLVRPK